MCFMKAPKTEAEEPAPPPPPPEQSPDQMDITGSRKKESKKLFGTIKGTPKTRRTSTAGQSTGSLVGTSGLKM